MLLASNPVKSIVAPEPGQTVDACEAPVNVGNTLTVMVPVVEATSPLGKFVTVIV